jgi:hypothetical protein
MGPAQALLNAQLRRGSFSSLFATSSVTSALAVVAVDLKAISYALKTAKSSAAA